MPLPEEMPILDGARVRLRPPVDADVDDLFAIFGDAAVMRYWSARPWPDRDEAMRLLARIRDGRERRESWQWGIALLPDDRIIGTITLFQVDEANQHAEVGYALGSAHWGRGYATEALRAVVAVAFDTLALHRLEADVDPENDASLRLLERVGFRRDGYLRERWLVAGERRDSVLLGMLAQDWRAAQE